MKKSELQKIIKEEIDTILQKYSNNKLELREQILIRLEWLNNHTNNPANKKLLMEIQQLLMEMTKEY